MEVAKSSLETARESKLILESVYSLLKRKVEQVSDQATESKLARLKKAVEVPGQVMSIIVAVGCYVSYIDQINEILEGIFRKLPDEADKIIPELEEIIIEVQSFEIRESSYALIGSVCTDLLNDLYPSDDIFSVTASDLPSSITSKVKYGEISNSSEVTLESSINDLQLTLVTDMSSKCSISFAGDIYEGVKEALSFSLPEKNTRMMLKFQHTQGGCCALVETQPTIAFSMSGVLGLRGFSVGGDVRFDTSSNVFTKYDLAGGYDTALNSFSVTIAEKCDVIRASIARKIFPGTSIGAQGSCSSSTGNKTLCLGVSHKYSDQTLLKAKVGLDSEGAFEGAAAVGYKWNKSSMSLSCALKYTKDEEFVPRFGICFTLF